MKNRSLILIFFVLMLLVTLFVAINYSSITPPPNTQGAHAAYFTKVRHPEISYEGEDFIWILTIYNQNFTIDGEENAYFYLIFYLDSDIWWNEYDTTEYQVWRCDRGNSVERSFSVSSWQTIKPVVHDLKIELYSYDGNSSQLQDVTQFSIKVAIHAELSNLMVFGHLAVYLLAILFLGFCILITGRIEISSTIQNATPVFNHQSTRTVSFSPKIGGRFFLYFYLFVFALWQVINALSYLFSLTEGFRQSLYFIVQVAYVILFILVIKREGSNFREYGYFWPEGPQKYVFISLLLAVFYTIIIIFLPGFFTSFNVFSSLSFMEVFSLILFALIFSLACESVFRGYIQAKLTNLKGFQHALLITSMMFTFYRVTLVPFDSFNVLYEVLSFFILGVFLGFLFSKTKTLLCPIFFVFSILILESLTPIRSITPEYVRLLSKLFASVASLLLLDVLTVKKKASFRSLSISEASYLDDL